MSSTVFYRKWRPQTLGELVGQEHVSRTLLNALGSGKVSHAYLFCGPRGTGKTSTGRILAKAVNCQTNQGKGEPCNTCEMCKAITEGRALDVIEVDAASNTGVDDIRSLREKVGYAPNQARYKFYIIDEFHMLSTAASNALLKTLEEPPPHVIFVLATTELHKVLPTIMSRCQRFDFRRIAQADVVAKLGSICQTEGIKVETEALRLIARATTGSLRDAENLLQQMTTYYGQEIELKQVQGILGITGDWRAREMVKHIVNGDLAAGVTTINSVNSDGLDLGQFNRELVQFLRALLLIKTGSEDAVDFTAEEKKELKDLADKATLPRIVKAVKTFGRLDFSMDRYSTLPMELALVDCGVMETKPTETTIVTAPRPVARPVTPPPAVKPKPVEARPVTTPTVQKPAATPPLQKPVAAPAAQKPPATAPVTPVKQPVAQTRTPSPAEAIGEIERLRLNWKQLIKDAPDSVSRSPAAALLRSARAKSIENDTVVLSFKFPLLKENMEKIENQKIAEKLISDFLGRPCRLRCIHEPEDDHLMQAALKMGARKIETED